MPSAADHEEISCGIAEGAPRQVIAAARIGRHPSVVSRETTRHGRGARYRATSAAVAMCTSWPCTLSMINYNEYRSREARTTVWVEAVVISYVIGEPPPLPAPALRDGLLGLDVWARLIYDEQFKSLAIPTVRAARQIVVAVVVGRDALDGTGDVIEPDEWFAVDHDSGDIVGLACRLFGPQLRATWRAVGELHRDYTPPEPGNPQEAIAVI